MTNKKTKPLLVIALVAVLIIVGIVTFMFSQGGKKSLEDYLDLGSKYLQEQDYDNAIAAFTEALKIDDMSVDTYLGLADAYVGKGDVDSAIECLEKGYSRTNNPKIKDLLDSLQQNNKNHSEVQELSFSLSDTGKELVSLLWDSDIITYNGHTYTSKDFSKMNLEQAVTTFSLNPPDPGNYSYYNEQFDISADSDGIMFFGNGSDYISKFSDTHTGCTLNYAKDGQISYDATMNDLFTFLDNNNINSVDDMAVLFIGKKLQSDETLVVEMGTSSAYLTNQFSDKSINIVGGNKTIAIHDGFAGSQLLSISHNYWN